MGNLFLFLRFHFLPSEFFLFSLHYVPLLPPPLYLPLQVVCLPFLFILITIKMGVAVFCFVFELFWVDLPSSFFKLFETKFVFRILSHSLSTGCCFLPAYPKLTELQSVVLGPVASINEGISWTPSNLINSETLEMLSNLCFDKPSMRFWYILKSESHHCKHCGDMGMASCGEAEYRPCWGIWVLFCFLRSC